MGIAGHFLYVDGSSGYSGADVGRFLVRSWTGLAVAGGGECRAQSYD